MARRNGQGPRQLQEITEKVRKGEHRLLKILEEEGLITPRESKGLMAQIAQAAAQKRAGEVLSATHIVHNKIIQVLRRSKVAGQSTDRSELEVLYEITRLTQSCDERSVLFDRLLDLIRQAIAYENATIFLVNRETNQLYIAATKGNPVDLIGGVKFESGFGFSSWVAKQKEPILLSEMTSGRRASGLEVGSFISIPLVVQGELIGVMNLSHSGARAFGDEHLRIAVLAGGQVAGVIQRFLMYEEMSRLAITDDLTGLMNRRHFAIRLEDEIERARRYRQAFSVAMIDIDHFKRINDAHGHAVGDRVLAEMGRLLRSSSRASDLASRYGGDEFALLMPMTDHSQALLAAERLRAAVQNHTFPRRKKLTVSIGVAAFLAEGCDAETLMRRADRAMYRAKQSGRDSTAIVAAQTTAAA